MKTNHVPNLLACAPFAMARRATTTSSGGQKAVGRTSRPRPTSIRATCISSSTPKRTARWWWICRKPFPAPASTARSKTHGMEPLTDIGFEGKGGKYLVLPPDYKGDVPKGYIPVRPATYNTMTLLRSIIASLSEKDLQAGNDLVKQVKVYPLSQTANPPAQHLLDMSDVMFNGLVKYDASFFTSLARMLDEETVQPRDLEMMGMLLPLGIETGKEFKPDAETVALLDSAAKEALAWLMDKAATDNTPWWPDSQWCIPTKQSAAADAQTSPSLTPLILFAASPGTITGVITLSVAHTRMKLPVTSLIAIGVATGITWLAMVLFAHFGGQPSGGGFSRGTLTRFMGLIVLSMWVQFALSGYHAFMK